MCCTGAFTAIGSHGASAKATAAECGISFGDSIQTSSGRVPCQTATADLDGDGHMDVVTGNCTSLDLSVLYGRGDGSFDPEIRIPLGVRSGGVAIADLDEDGFPDVFATAENFSHLNVIWGASGRTMNPPVTLPAPGGPFRIRATDLDEDGHPDLLLLSSFVDGVSVIWGDSTRTPASVTDIPLSFRPTFIEVADLNQDGHPDLVVTKECVEGEVFTLLGDGSRLPTSFFASLVVPGTILCFPRIGFLNEDAIPDIAVTDGATPDARLVIAHGRGDGTFAFSVSVPVGGQFATDVRIDDYDGDGVNDVAVTCSSSHDIAVLKGSSFAAATRLDPGNCVGHTESADWDEDGKIDLLAILYCGDAVSFYPNTSVFHVASASLSPASIQHYTSGPDLDATLTFPSGGISQVDPSGVTLTWNGNVLGGATSVDSSAAAGGVLRFRFARQLLAGISTGEQVLSVDGCDISGAAFGASALLRVFARRSVEIWQISPPDVRPVRIHVPDRFAGGHLAMDVFNVSGRLIDQRARVASTGGVVEWGGEAKGGIRAMGGIYFVQLRDGPDRAACKLVLLH